MSQLINRGINTIKYTNTLLRNAHNFGNFIVLRNEETNLPEFTMLNVFKDLVLDLARQFDAEKITDVAIVITEIGQDITLPQSENRILLILENEASFVNGDKRYIPLSGDLIWTNETITINNHSNNKSIVLVIDFKEFLL